MSIPGENITTDTGNPLKTETANPLKTKKIKCYQCKKKCTFINFQCDCDHTFCLAHRYPHSHECNSTIKKKMNIETVEKNNPKMITSKMDAI